LEAYSRPRANGINAITIVDGDELLEAKLTNGSCEIIMGTREGKAIRFNEATVRPVGRTAQGVKAVNLDTEETPDNEVIGMVCVSDPNSDILVVSEQGMGKRSALEDYRITNRGGKGVKTINVTEKTGKLISILAVDNDHDFMIINKSGITIRLRVEELRVVGRATQGVKLINLRGNDEIAAVCTVLRDEEEQEGAEIEGSIEPMDDAPESDESTATGEESTDNNE
jgi:DNA gyrase subunit A